MNERCRARGTSITSAQAMLHPTVVETINALSELCRELREELETARADEREACAKLCMAVPRTGAYFARLIRARGTT
jgi:hypothetical protein